MAERSKSSKMHSDFEENTKKYYPSIYFMRRNSSLPKNWKLKGKVEHVQLTQSNLTVQYQNPWDEEQELQPLSLKADNSAPFMCGLYYYEVIICSKSSQGSIMIGLQTSTDSVKKLPGSSATSFGYHSYSGELYNDIAVSKYGPSFAEGDIVGCGVDFVNNTFFYTKNGQFLGKAFEGKLNALYSVPLFPAVGMSGGSVKVSANFGQKPFLFALSEYLSRVRSQYIQRITSDHCTDEFAFIRMKELIGSYLGHHGFVSTMKSFAKSTGQSCEKGIEAVEHRKEVRTHIFQGRYDTAIDLIQRHYSSVFHVKPGLLFELRCRQFVEAVRENQRQLNNSCAQMSSNTSKSNPQKRESTGQTKPLQNSRTLGTTRKSGVQRSPSDPVSTSASSTRKVAKLRHSPIERGDNIEMMEVESGEEEASVISNSNMAAIGDPCFTAPATSSSLVDQSLRDLIRFGQDLNIMQTELVKTGHISQSNKALLRNAFGLLAYKDPMDSPLSHLLNEKCKEKMSSLVNTAILEAQNLPKQPQLELAIRQLDMSIMRTSEALVGIVHPRMFLHKLLNNDK